MLEGFELHMNRKLNGCSVVVPEGVRYLVVNTQKLAIVRLPSTIQMVQMRSTVVTDLISGWLPQEVFECVNTVSIYRSAFKNIVMGCREELQRSLAMEEDSINAHWHLCKLEQVQKLNTETIQRIYDEFGSIPRRIRNAYENQHNPIVAAMHLASNYPRRMAEFVTEVTMIGYTFV